MRLYAEVAFPLRLDTTFTYDVPHDLPPLAVGQRVLAPFRNRLVTGYVVALPSDAGEIRTRPIRAVLDDLPLLTPELLSVARYIAERYGTGLGEALTVVVPPGMAQQTRRKIFPTEKLQNPESESERKWLLKIQKGKGIDWTAAVRRDHEAESLFHRWEKKGWIRVETVLVRDRARDKSALSQQPFVEPAGSMIQDETSNVLQLSADQKAALLKIEESWNRGAFARFLLHGITGSGKTEIYLRSSSMALNAGRSVLALVPEISLTSQFLNRFRARFGEKVAVLHSGRSESDRLTEWNRVRRGEANVVIGARSAVFAPLQNIGLIILDEAHDPSYKQGDGIRYQARDVAAFRAKKENAILLLGSATPAVETYQAALNGEFELLRLPSRVTQHGLPSVRIVDLRNRISRFGEKGLFSEELLEAIAGSLGRQEQTILFLNRRGFAPLIYCPSCGSAARCENCSVTVTFHERENRCLCHYCGASYELNRPCIECGQCAYVKLGTGTERAERELRFRFPDARIARMDRDSVRTRGSHGEILGRLERGELDILIGTQMITKGLDLPKVSLVGVLLADQSLHFPDFRAAERTFQLLTQVAGRSGRGGQTGEAIVQTFQPHHYAIAFAADQNYEAFFQREIEHRRALGYPPFSSLAMLELVSSDSDAVRAGAQWLARQCRGPDSKIPKGIEFLGPAPAPIRRLAGKTRYHLLIRSPAGSLAAAYSRWLRERVEEALERRHVSVRLDIDPEDFL